MITFLAPASMCLRAFSSVRKRPVDSTTISVLYGHLVVEAAVNGVIFQHVSQILRVEQIVDADYLDVIRKFVDCSAEYHAADTAESIDTNFNFCHCCKILKSAAKICILMELIYICAQICIKI